MRKKGLLLPFGREVTSSRFHRKSLDLAEISDTFICKPDKEQIEQILLALGENLQKAPFANSKVNKIEAQK